MGRELFFCEIESPVGRLGLAVDAQGRLAHLHFLRERHLLPGGTFAAVIDRDEPGARRHEDRERCAPIIRQLEEYFAGERSSFDLEIAPLGTEFEQAVWQELTRIPAGQTRSYGEMARLLGKEGAARAVGRANARNPIAIVVPCHRVIGSNGHLTGFGGGLDVKAWLLELEGHKSTSDRQLALPWGV
jgi:methylated-DNA-[protein]-cysteine S-methyltransferase